MMLSDGHNKSLRTFHVDFQPDAGGYVGRECPEKSCQGYFKVLPGTGLPVKTCVCPYCGHKAGQDHFHTKEQIEYATSVAVHQVIGEMRQQLKSLEFEHKPVGPFGIGVSMKLKEGPVYPIRYYREKQLETDITCDKCTLKYAVYGVFAFCPDCGVHNSRQILSKNLELCRKQLSMATEAEPELSDLLVANSMEDAVSAFDGFGRECCLLKRKDSGEDSKSNIISFQNLERAGERLHAVFDLDLSGCLGEQEWESAIRCFQKRHLLAHKMRIVDAEYIAVSRDNGAVVGRKVAIAREEVDGLIAAVEKMGDFLFQRLVHSETKQG